MIDPRSRAFDRLRRQLVPLATSLLAVVLDLLPLPDTSPGSLAPFFTVCVVAYWTLHNPDLMSPLATFAVGIVLDAAGGMPLGVSPLAFLIVRSALLTGQGFLAAQPFPVLWGCFVAVLLAVELVRWLAVSLFFGRVLPLQPILFQCCLTVAVYPVVSSLLTRLRQSLVLAPHAARS